MTRTAEQIVRDREKIVANERRVRADIELRRVVDALLDLAAMPMDDPDRTTFKGLDMWDVARVKSELAGVVDAPDDLGIRIVMDRLESVGFISKPRTATRSRAPKLFKAVLLGTEAMHEWMANPNPNKLTN